MVSFILADRHTWSNAIKQIDGQDVIPVATQKSIRSKKTTYVYRVGGTGKIVYNTERGGVMFLPIAVHEANMARYWDIFVRAPLTDQERAWLARNNYTLVTQ